MKKPKNKAQKIAIFNIVSITALIGLAICLGLIAFLTISVKSDIARLNTITNNQNLLHENSSANEILIVQYYQELSDKTDAAINKILIVVGTFASIITIFGVVLAFRAPKEIESKMNELNSKMKEAIDAADNAKYQAEILDALNVNNTVYTGEITDSIRLHQITSVIRKHPNKYDAYAQRAFIQIRMSEREELLENKQHELLWRVISDLEIARGLGQSIDENYSAIGFAYDRLEWHDKAINFYTKAINYNPDYDPAYTSRGITYRRKGEYLKAIEDYDKAIELSGDVSVDYINRSVAYCNLWINELDKDKPNLDEIEKYMHLQELDLMKASDIDPDDEYVKRELDELREFKQKLKQKMENDQEKSPEP